MLNIKGLKVENQTTGYIDTHRPRFSYYVESDQNEVNIVDATFTLGSWTKSSKDQLYVLYDGPKFMPYTSYEVKVEVIDNKGDRATANVTFETGKLDTPWDAKWITDGNYHFKGKKQSPKPMTFKKVFNKEKPVKSAKVYATTIGIYELNLNGKKVGKDYFAPGFTSYKHDLQYQVYDISKEIKKTNELIAVVGGGWAVGPFTYVRRTKVFGDKQALLCEIRIEYQDGSIEVIGTDESWDVSLDGNYVFTEFYDGEIFDATIDMNQIEYHSSKVTKLKIKPEISVSIGAMVKHMDTIKAVNYHISNKGTLIYDFGQNIAGVISIKVNAKAGQKITFRHAEILMDGELYTEPLRTAKQEIIYIAKDGEQTYSPKMTFMGFQYVSVEGVDPKDLDIEAYVLYSDIESTGSFECSNEQLNKLQHNIIWSAKSNFIDIPTDCPQRDERMGWTGDIALFAQTATYNFDMSRFFDKWLRDVKSEQSWGGGIPMTVPLVKVPLQYEIAIPMAVDHWGDACILVPWAEYMTRGDLNVLRTMYPVMKKYVKAALFWSGLFSFGKHRRIWRLLHHYGDWVAPESSMMEWMRRGRWTATASLANITNLLSKISTILDNDKDAKYYKKISSQASDAYRSILMNKDCSINKEFQTGYVLPLHYDMLNKVDSEKAVAHLSRMIKDNNYNIATGFPGTPYVLFALADYGHLDDAYKMLLNDSAPSWLFMVKAGATTIWEKWDALRADGTSNTGKGDGLKTMVSYNHYANGAVGDFFYKRIAGIEPLEGGYKSFKIMPRLGGNLTYAKASVLTGYGEVISDWAIQDNQFIINISVPVGTTCNLYLPSGKLYELNSGTYQFSEKMNGDIQQ